RRHTRSKRDWSSDVCSSDLAPSLPPPGAPASPPSATCGPAGGTTTTRAKFEYVGSGSRSGFPLPYSQLHRFDEAADSLQESLDRSEERRVGKECKARRSSWS